MLLTLAAQDLEQKGRLGLDGLYLGVKTVQHL